MVFAIGSTTVLPALRSFCLWCGVGILAVYLYQITLFVAVLALDCRRLAAGRNGLCPCYTHPAPPGPAPARPQHSLAQRAFSQLSRLVLSPGGSLAVLACSAALLGSGIWQATQLTQGRAQQQSWFQWGQLTRSQCSPPDR